MTTHLPWSRLNPVVTFANRLVCAPGFQFGPRTIEEHQFIYVEKGTGEARIGEERFEAAAGDLFYYGPGVPHRFRADDARPFVVYGVHFSVNGELQEGRALLPPVTHELPAYPDDAAAVPLAVGSPEARLIVPARVRNCGWAEEWIAAIAADFERRGEMTDLHNRARMLMLLIRLRDHLLADEGVPDEKLRRLKRELDRRAEEPYRREWLKEWTHYHEDHAARLFARAFGMTPHQYHLRAKIQLAKHDLAATERSVGEIAERLGFGTIHYFSRMFKKHAGMSPIAYRKLSRMI